MKFIIQSKVCGDTKWAFRSESTDQISAIKNIVDTKKVDLKLKMKNNQYRIVNKNEKVLFILPDDYVPL